MSIKRTPAGRELRGFLQSEAAKGVHDSEGTFTIDRSRALSKRREWTLPSEHHWLLKIIQAAVAADSEWIRVELHLRDVAIKFRAREEWSKEQLNSGLLGEHTATSRSLEHLQAALVDRQREETAFQFHPAGSNMALFWDGSALGERKLEEAQDFHQVVVSFLKAGGSDAKRNLDLTDLCLGKAYPCPIPIHLDGFRFDSLWRVSADRNRSNFSLPLKVHYAPCESGNFLPPLGTDGNIIAGQLQVLEPRLQTITETRAGATETQRRALRGASVLCLALEKVLIENHPDKIWGWKERGLYGLAVFVSDGVIVQEDRLSLGFFPVHGRCYLSADSMPTDLSGFALLDSTELQAKRQLASQLLTEAFAGPQELEFSPPELGVPSWLGGFLDRLHILGQLLTGKAQYQKVSSSRERRALEFQLGEFQQELRRQFFVRPLNEDYSALWLDEIKLRISDRERKSFEATVEWGVALNVSGQLEVVALEIQDSTGQSTRRYLLGDLSRRGLKSVRTIFTREKQEVTRELFPESSILGSLRELEPPFPEDELAELVKFRDFKMAMKSTREKALDPRRTRQMLQEHLFAEHLKWLDKDFKIPRRR